MYPRYPRFISESLCGRFVDLTGPVTCRSAVDGQELPEAACGGLEKREKSHTHGMVFVHSLDLFGFLFHLFSPHLSVGFFFSMSHPASPASLLPLLPLLFPRQNTQRQHTPRQHTHTHTHTETTHTETTHTQRSHTPRPHTQTTHTETTHTEATHTPRQHTPRPHTHTEITHTETTHTETTHTETTHTETTHTESTHTETTIDLAPLEGLVVALSAVVGCCPLWSAAALSYCKLQ